MSHLVLSFVAPDRTGLVETLSNIVKTHQGNWQASSMHHMAGSFAGVIEISVNSDKVDAIIADVNNIDDINAVFRQSEVQSSTQAPNLVLELTANDRTGIVQEISSTIHQQGGNLLKLVSSPESAAHSGQTLFKAKATITVSEQNVESLIDSLENLADDLMVDISR